MRTLQHRRHSQRDPNGVHLNAAGLARARQIAPGLPRFARVVTSPRPRAMETAEALGFPVDATLSLLGELPDDLGIDLVERLRGLDFEGYARLAQRSTEFRRYASEQARLWREQLERVPDGASMLMVSHGSIIEAGAVGALLDVAADWGPALDYLEGVELRLDDGHWVSGAPLRVPGDANGAG